jgi:DNA-binding CsgD family transcriptional regulator
METSAMERPVMEPLRTLTYREAQFLALTAQGKQWRQIAAECFVSHRTVEHALARAREKLSATTTPQAVVRAIAYEMLILDSEGNVFLPTTYNCLAA